MPPRRPPPRGFTLIEVVIVTLLMGMLAFLFTGIFQAASDSATLVNARKGALGEGRLAAGILVRDIRQCRDIYGISYATATRFRFVDAAGATQDFEYSAGTLTRNGRPLAGGLSAFQFRYWRLGGTELVPPVDRTEIWRVTADLTAREGTESVHLRSEAFPRNFAYGISP